MLPRMASVRTVDVYMHKQCVPCSSRTQEPPWEQFYQPKFVINILFCRIFTEAVALNMRLVVDTRTVLRSV